MAESTSSSSPSAGYDNPWESAANDRLWSDAQHGIPSQHDGFRKNSASLETSATGQGAAAVGAAATAAAAVPDNYCFFQCFQACHWLDILLSVGIILMYFLSIGVFSNSNNTSHSPLVTILLHIFFFALATLWMTRGILAKITKCGVRVSASMSLILALCYVLLAFLLWILQLVHANTAFVMCLLPTPSTCQSHPKLQLYILLLFSIFEFIRFVWIRQWMLEEQEQIHSRNNNNNNNTSLDQDTNYSHRATPWWWSFSTSTSSSTRHEGQEPLLSSSPTNYQQRRRYRPHWTSNQQDYLLDDGITSPTTNTTSSNTNGALSSWWPFSRNSNGNANANSRDDGSVDYASLNEDWASRSEEDPFWWAQESN